MLATPFSEEIKQQSMSQIGRLPDEIIACVGGGSNAMGAFSAFLDDTDVGMACRNQEDLSVGERAFDILGTVTFFYVTAQSTPCG